MYNKKTSILQRSKYLQSCLGLGILLCSKLPWFFFFKNLLFWWQALDGVLVEPPEMGLLGNSGKKVTNDCIALIHLHIQPIYLSNIFVFLWASFKSTRYICLEMLYRFNRIIHLHNQEIYFSNMVVFLYTPSQCSFDRYICQILFPFFYTPTQQSNVYQTSFFCFDISLCSIYLSNRNRKKNYL